jgi:tetratricopeptide (TPR) repeat protein
MVMCYQAKGDLDTAIELTRKYIAQEPEDILAFTNLSMFYQKKGMIKEAEEAGAEARRLDWKRQLKEGVAAGKK